eukprot:1161839-Pelagomonas_calceolata.AAC.6
MSCGAAMLSCDWVQHCAYTHIHTRGHVPLACRLLSAMSRGAAMLSCDWVQHCAYMACYVPPEAHPDPGFHVMQPPRPHLRPHGLFAGKSEHIAGCATR